MTTIETLRENIENLTEEVSNFDTFTQQRIEEILNLEEKEAQLNQLEEDFEQAQSEEEYIEIATSLFAIEIPSSIISTSLGEVNLYFQKSNVNLDSLTAITGEEYGSESSKYIDSVLSWQQEKFKTKGTTQKIFFKYEDETEEVLNIFDLRFEKSGSYEPYFIIENIANMKMSLNFSERTDYSYVKIASSENRLKISTTEAVGVTEIPAFISPKLSELNLKGIKKEKEDFDFKLLIIILAILIVLIVAYFLVVFLNRKKKEKKLFGNKKNAENILKYIKKEKEKGTPDFEIKNNLRKSQWTPEQIEYVMEKHSK